MDNNTWKQLILIWEQPHDDMLKTLKVQHKTWPSVVPVVGRGGARHKSNNNNHRFCCGWPASSSSSSSPSSSWLLYIGCRKIKIKSAFVALLSRLSAKRFYSFMKKYASSPSIAHHHLFIMFFLLGPFQQRILPLDWTTLVSKLHPKCSENHLSGIHTRHMHKHYYYFGQNRAPRVR